MGSEIVMGDKSDVQAAPCRTTTCAGRSRWGADDNKPDTELPWKLTNSCLLLHNDAWIKVTFLCAAFCHAAAILVRKSASPYLGSCPSEGQHEGQQDEKTASRQAWASSLGPLEAQFPPSASH